MSEFIKRFNAIQNKLESIQAGSIEFKEWEEKFWEIESEKTPAVFAQRGYEDKGTGHIQKIILNVKDLLYKYSQVLSWLNPNDKKLEAKYFQHLEPNLIMFFTASHLHDIGMNFPGIFDALTALVKAGGDSALHIGEIIHNYHHYATFIVLLEIDFLVDGIPENETQCPYLYKIQEKIEKEEKDNKVYTLRNLKKILSEIYKNFKDYIDDEKEFFIILGILCLLHQEVNQEYLQSILRKYENEDLKKNFNKRWDEINRSRDWTKKAMKGIYDSRDIKKRLADGSQLLLKPGDGSQNQGALDLVLVEALLQYGDKTEITIDRLTRKEVDDKEPITQKTHLKRFIDDSRYDNENGFICTDMARRVISPFARFRACRFIPLFFVEVNEMKDSEQSSEKKTGLEIILHYLRFENDEEIFRILRYHNEKDFFDLEFLDFIRIHIPLLLNNNKDNFENNPIFDIKFMKKEHCLLNLEDKLTVLLNHLIESARKQINEKKNNIDNPDSSGKSPSEAEELFLEFFKTKKIKEIIKEYLSSDEENIKKNFKERLHFDDKIIIEVLKKCLGSDDKKVIEILKKCLNSDDENIVEILNDFNLSANIDIEEILKECLCYDDKRISDILKENFEIESEKYLAKKLSKNTADKKENIRRDLETLFDEYKEKRLDKIIDNANSIQFADQDKDEKNLLSELNSRQEILKGIENLRKTIFRESKMGINPRQRFPYTAQNRKAVRQFSKSILDPEEKKKAGVKKVFFKTPDLIVPSSFEVMAILNLFREEV